jgi:DNA polymerase I-like protein with 3'-5' exonuclease and polymerase domains
VTARAPRYVVFDCETHPVTHTLKAPPIVSLAAWASDGSTGGVSLWLREEGLDHLEGWLREPEVVFIGANIAFDMTCACASRPSLLPLIVQAYEAGRVQDVQVMERLLQIGKGAPRQKVALDKLVERHLGKDVSHWKQGDVWRTKYDQLDGVPLEIWPSDAREYAVLDVEWTRDVYREILKKLVRQMKTAEKRCAQYMVRTREELPDLIGEIEHQTRAAFVLHQPHVSGVRTERGRVRELRERTQVEFSDYREIAKKHGLVRANNSKNEAAIRDALTEYINDHGAKHLIEQTPGGQLSIKSKILKLCTEPGGEGLLALGQSGKSEKLLTAFLDPLLALPTNTVHSRYNVLVDSGRTSAFGPNVQQVSRDGGLRECYVARPGCVFIGSDYDTLEMRSLAQVAYRRFGASDMRDALIEGKDLHLDFAAELMAISYLEAQRLKDAGDATVKENRQFAKVGDFGFPGGLGVRTFVEYAANFGVFITEAQAQDLKQRFLKKWREMRLYFQDASNASKVEPRQLKIIQGLGRVRGNITYTRFCNTWFQGLAADGAKEALWEVQKACWDPESPLYGSRIVLFIHDEIVIETRESSKRWTLQQKGEELDRCMVRGMQKWIPDVPITSGYVVMRRWSKDASNKKMEVWDDQQAA